MELTVEYMKDWIRKAPPHRLGNALVAMCERQTEDEKADSCTKHENGIGFNKFDAGALTDISRRFYVTHEMTPRQVAIVRSKLVKYARQLTEIVLERKAQQWKRLECR